MLVAASPDGTPAVLADKWREPGPRAPFGVSQEGTMEPKNERPREPRLSYRQMLVLAMVPTIPVIIECVLLFVR